MDKFVPVVNRRDCCKVPLEDILYIESEGRRIRIVTDDKVFCMYAKLCDMEPYFEDDVRFFPCIKGMFVNFDHVSSMKDQTIFFRNGTKYILGRTNFLRTKQTFVGYLRNSNKNKKILWENP